MKYTIHGLSQSKLIEAGLDNDDALILSVIKDMYSSKNMQFQIISPPLKMRWNIFWKVFLRHGLPPGDKIPLLIPI